MFDLSPRKETVEEFIKRKQAEGTTASETVLVETYNELKAKKQLISAKLARNATLDRLRTKIQSPLSAATTVTPEEVRYGIDKGLLKDIYINTMITLLNSTEHETGRSYVLRSYFDRKITEAYVEIRIKCNLIKHILFGNIYEKDIGNVYYMNSNQRKVLIAVALSIIAMGLYPPFHINLKNGVFNSGYHWIFSPPSQASNVDVGLLLTQWIGVILIGTIGYLYYKKG